MKNEQGITLIEVIAALAISSLILIITFSLIHQSQNEHKTQLKNNQTLTKNSYVLKQLSRDIRESVSIDNSSTNNEVTLIKHDNSRTSYKFDSTQNLLFRDHQQIADDLKSFNLDIVNNSVNIQLVNLRNELIKTTIYIRGD